MHNVMNDKYSVTLDTRVMIKRMEMIAAKLAAIMCKLSISIDAYWKRVINMPFNNISMISKIFLNI